MKTKDKEGFCSECGLKSTDKNVSYYICKKCNIELNKEPNPFLWGMVGVLGFIVMAYMISEETYIGVFMTFFFIIWGWIGYLFGRNSEKKQDGNT